MAIQSLIFCINKAAISDKPKDTFSLRWGWLS